MNRRHLILVSGMAVAVLLSAGALISSTAEGEVPAPMTGAAAPDFSGLNSRGETIRLSDFAGQTIVLEWTNHGCPFVQKHYDSAHSNMQTLQGEADADGTVWLSVISSAPGKQGHVSGEEADSLSLSRGAMPDHVIIDENGEIGRLFKARTTPHMFIVHPDGTLAYDGAIDSIASARVSDVPLAENHVRGALAALAAGETPDPARTKPYGCSVKY